MQPRNSSFPVRFSFWGSGVGNTKVVVKAVEAEKPVDTTTKISAIKQNKATTFSATFSADATGIKDTDVKIVRDETGAVVTVKSVKVDKKDNTLVTIETYESLTDGKAYTVTYTASDEAKTQSTATFTATTGVVADVALSTYSIPANTPTELKYQTLDANGVVIAEAGIGSSAANYMEISVENANGYQKDNELVLYKTGDTATLKVVYHTFKYANGVEEGKVEKKFTVTAVDQSSVIETFDYSVVAKAGDTIDFTRDKLVQQVAMDDDATNVPYAKFSFRTAENKDITKSLDYTVSSGNENVLLASGTVAGGAQLTPVGVGATYLIIKDASGNVVTTLPINVVAKRALSTMSVDKSSVTISKSVSDASGKQKITVAAMDQYSEAYSNYSIAQPELKSTKSDAGLSVTAARVANNKTVITIDATGATVGTYAYTMDLVDDENFNNVKKISFTVTVSEQLTGTSYALVMMDSSQSDIISKVDTTVTDDTFTATTLKPTIVVKNNGSITGKADADIVSIGAVTLTKNGVVVKNVNNSIYGPISNSDFITNAAIKVTEGTGATGDPIKKNLEPGTYTISFKANIRGLSKLQDMSTSFVVEDSQKVFEAAVKKEAVTDGKNTLAQVFEDEDYVKFSYAGHEVNKADYNYSYADADYTKINNTNSLRVNKVSMNIVLPGTDGKLVQMTTAINRTFTFGEPVSTKATVKAEIASFEKAYVSGGALISNTTTKSAVEVIKDYQEIANAYNALASADQTADVTAKMTTVKGYAQDAAKILVADVATNGASSDSLNLDVLTVLDVQNATVADIACYKDLIVADTSTFNSASAVTTSALQTVVDDTAILKSVSVATKAGITTGVAVTATKTGATLDGGADVFGSAQTSVTLNVGENLFETAASVANKTITISATTYKAEYTISTDSSKTVTAISAPKFTK